MHDSFRFSHRLSGFWLLATILVITPWACQTTNRLDRSQLVVECRLQSVHDGDTIRARCNSEGIKIRLYCVDAPELAQKPWGRESRDALREWLPRGSQFKLHRHGKDQYGRYIGEIIKGDENLNERLVLSGYAAVYQKYCPSKEQRYYLAEQAAKQGSLGIWETPGLHQTPWRWRKHKTTAHRQ